jgi:hypothetical protein
MISNRARSRNIAERDAENRVQTREQRYGWDDSTDNAEEAREGVRTNLGVELDRHNDRGSSVCRSFSCCAFCPFACRRCGCQSALDGQSTQVCTWKFTLVSVSSRNLVCFSAASLRLLTVLASKFCKDLLPLSVSRIALRLLLISRRVEEM